MSSNTSLRRTHNPSLSRHIRRGSRSAMALSGVVVVVPLVVEDVWSLSFVIASFVSHRICSRGVLITHNDGHCGFPIGVINRPFFFGGIGSCVFTNSECAG